MQREIIWVIAGVGVLFILASASPEVENVVMAVSDDPDFVKYDSLFQTWGGFYNVPWRWLKAICMNESSLGKAHSVARGLENPSDVDGSVSTDGKSWGLMQLTLATARGLVDTPVDAITLNDANTSVRLAAMLVKQLIGTFGSGDKESVIRAYNGGPRFGTATLPYWARFQANMAIILSKQPGDEDEII